VEFVGALIAGIFVGSVLGFIGAGGAMLSVPILLYLFHFDPKSATTAALAVVFIAALSGAIPKARSGQILYKEALVIVGIGSVTNLGFASIAFKLNDSFIKTGFALTLCVAASSMLVNPQYRQERKMSWLTLILISLTIGTMTGIFGIGGGFLAIPVLVLFFGTPQSKASGTSLLIISFNSLISLLGHHSLWKTVTWHIPLIMGIAAVITAQIASHFADRTPTRILRVSFALLLFIVSGITILETWLFKTL